jgi:hypothetical protein
MWMRMQSRVAGTDGEIGSRNGYSMRPEITGEIEDGEQEEQDPGNDQQIAAPDAAPLLAGRLLLGGGVKIRGFGKLKLTAAAGEQGLIGHTDLDGILPQISKNIERGKVGELAVFKSFDMGGADVDQAGYILDRKATPQAFAPQNYGQLSQRICCGCLI